MAQKRLADSCWPAVRRYRQQGSSAWTSCWRCGRGWSRESTTSTSCLHRLTSSSCSWVIRWVIRWESLPPLPAVCTGLLRLPAAEWSGESSGGRVYHLYQLSAQAYFVFLQLSDQVSHQVGEFTTSTSCLHRLTSSSCSWVIRWVIRWESLPPLPAVRTGLLHLPAAEWSGESPGGRV